jgi:GGDEF domain-containing protein
MAMSIEMAIVSNRRTAEPGTLRDPLTGFGTRDKLMADLAEAVGLADAPWTLAIFDIGGFRRYVELYGRIEGEALLVRVAQHLAATLGERITYYRPRYEEFAVLVPAPPASAEAELTAAAAGLTSRLEHFSVTLTYGAAILPSEAADPTEAMSLADTRLFLHASERRARERRAVPRVPPR